MLVDDVSRSCGDRFEHAKSSFIHDVESAEARCEKIYFELETGVAARKSRHTPSLCGLSRSAI